MNLPYFEDEQAKKIQIEILSIFKKNLTISADFEQIISDFLFGVMTCYKQEYTTHYCQSVQNHLNQCDSNEFLLKSFFLIKIPLLLNGYLNYLDNNQRFLYRFECFLWSIQQLINKIIYQHECFKNEIFRMSWLTQLETITKQMMIEGTIHQLSFNQDNTHYIKRFLQKISQVNDLFLIDNFVNDLNILLDESDSENFTLITKKLFKIPYQVAKYFKQGYEKDKAIYSQDNKLFISAYCLGKISYSLLNLIINHHCFHSVYKQEVLFETIANELINNQNLFFGSSSQFPSHLLFVWIQIFFELQKKDSLSASLYETIQSKLPTEFKCTHFFESKSQSDRYLKAKQVLTYPLHEFYQYNLPLELLSKDGIAALWPLKIFNTMIKMPYEEQKLWLDFWQHSATDRFYINNMPSNNWLNTAHNIHNNLASTFSQQINQWLIEILDDAPRKDKPFSLHNEKIICSMLWFASFGEAKTLNKTIAKYAKFFETSIKPHGSRSFAIAKTSQYCVKKWALLQK